MMWLGQKYEEVVLPEKLETGRLHQKHSRLAEQMRMHYSVHVVVITFTEALARAPVG